VHWLFLGVAENVAIEDRGAYGVIVRQHRDHRVTDEDGGRTVNAMSAVSRQFLAWRR